MPDAKIAQAIKRIQTAYEIAESHGNTLISAYSGGKDSDVLLDLAIKSGVPFRAEHNHTTVDAPETVYHIRDVFASLQSKGIPTTINYPKMSMWQLIVKNGIPPLKHIRYCCEYLKERRFDNQHLLLGVRWNESSKRARRGLHEKLGLSKKTKVVYQDENDEGHKLTEICLQKSRVVTNPLIDWTDRQIWEYIRHNDLKVNPLYKCGFQRVGCIGCPYASKRGRDFTLYPKYKAAYIRAFDRMLIVDRAKRVERGLSPEPYGWRKDGESVFRWWTDPKFDPNQLVLED